MESQSGFDSQNPLNIDNSFPSDAMLAIAMAGMKARQGGGPQRPKEGRFPDKERFLTSRHHTAWLAATASMKGVLMMQPRGTTGAMDGILP